MYDVVCVGNALIDTFLTIHEASDHCRMDYATGELCVKLGDKIPLENAQFELGGNACNVSVGLARLGLHNGFIGELGSDAFGHKIKKQLENENVSLNHSIISDTLSSFAIGIQFKSERVLFVHHLERKHAFQFDHIKTNWVYLSSLGEQWRHVYSDVASYIRESGSHLAFNPGTRQIDAGEEVLEKVMAVTEMLFLNKEEAQKIVQMPDEHDVQILLKALQKLGPKTVIITDGQHGSFVIDAEGKYYHQGIIHAKVIEKTGAGDSFASAFLAATIYGYDIQTALQWGSVNAASVIGKVGAQPGLLTKQQMEMRLKNQ